MGRIMVNNFGDIYETAQERAINMRQTAYVLAVDRVAAAAMTWAIP